jgi:hypothetical protein
LRDVAAHICKDNDDHNQGEDGTDDVHTDAAIHLEDMGVRVYVEAMVSRAFQSPALGNAWEVGVNRSEGREEMGRQHREEASLFQV